MIYSISINAHRALRTFEIASEFFALWVILKAGEICGKILVKYSALNTDARIAIILFDKTSANTPSVYGYERISGYEVGNSDTSNAKREKLKYFFDTGIANILTETENRDKLKSAFGIQLSEHDGKSWERDFKAGGFDVARVL